MHVRSTTVKSQAEAGKRMAEDALQFLRALTPGQREKVSFDVSSEERLNWHYIPRPRKGLSLKEMDGFQRRLAWVLISAGLSREGWRKAMRIMGLERILGEIEGPSARFERDPDLFYVSVFGDPAGESPWGWRLEGHHVSLNFLVAGGKGVGCTPNFMGANPARVPRGYPLEGLRILEGEEEFARALLTSLSPEQRLRSIFSSEAPPDILTGADPKVLLDAPLGLPGAELKEPQRQKLMDLIGEYVNRMPEEIADSRLNEIAREGQKHIHFAWAGSAEPGRPHYYRVHGPSFLIEYDNTQNNANHIHSVWRDPRNDWGEDLLKAHFRRSHRPGRQTKS
jgi:Protein of unknown function (DUF3500)